MLSILLLSGTLGMAAEAPRPNLMNEDGWSWPSAAANLHLRREIMRQTLTPEERRNIQTVLELESGTGRMADRDRWYAKSFKTATRSGFQELDDAFGRNDYAVPAVLNRINLIEDIIAKGNRVIVMFRAIGNLNSPMFTFEPVGQAIDAREMLAISFDQEGMITEIWPWGEGMVLYEQLGGTIVLPPSTAVDAQPSRLSR